MSQFVSASSPPRFIITVFIVYVCISCTLSHWVPTAEFTDSLKNTVDALQNLSSKAADFGNSEETVWGNFPPSKAMNQCVSLLESSAKAMNLSLSAIQNVEDPDTDDLYLDLTKLLTSIMSNQGFCLNGLGEQNILAAKILQESFTLVKDLLSSLHGSPNSKLNLGGSSLLGDSLPIFPWIKAHVIPSLYKFVQLPTLLQKHINIWGSETADELARRRILRGISSGRGRKELGPGEIADFIVSKAGAGHFRRIQDAIDAVPSNSRRPYIIHVASGVYYEQIEVPNWKTNIRLIGDGAGSTIITASHHVQPDGSGSFDSATVAIFANGFVAKGITFENAAGPNNNQAIALRAKGDQIAFHECEFRSYQDTLLLEGGRQFFKECTIRGTVDFICGDARAFFQDCRILIRGQPSKGYYTITAHSGRYNNGNTQGGFVFQHCEVSPDRDYDGKHCYLGRPWKQYACTVFMQTYLSDIVDPKGWRSWDSQPRNLETSIYGEYSNFGPGAETSRRVSSSNYLRGMSLPTARIFTVAVWINGNTWLPGTGIPFVPLGL